MKSIMVYLLSLFTTMIQAQTGSQIIIGKSDSVYSKILHENRKIWVHVPNNDSPDGVFVPEHYPVVYLLDGWEQNFSVLTSMIELLSGGGGNLAFPKMIVVGIPNTNRTRDLTPTHVAALPMMDSAEASTSGGGEQFISFMQKELIPHIDSLYPTAPYRIFIGHSLGGLMTLYTVIHYTNLFNAYEIGRAHV